MQTRSTTPILNEIAADTPVQGELNLGGNEPINNIDLNQKAVVSTVVKKKAGRPPKEWTKEEIDKNPDGYNLVMAHRKTLNSV